VEIPTDLAVAPYQPSASLNRSAQASLESLYFAATRRWVVAFSGGKDSTVVLQPVFEMLVELGDKAKKPVVVLSSDTRVEAPNVAAYITDALHKVEESAQALRVPLSTRLIEPTASESFWGKLIGKGYPPPSRWFRWCTSNMKIKPSRRAIDEITQAHGSVILLLGSRITESAQRGRTMQERSINSRGLNPHHEIPNALVATPIAEWTTDDVWEYLASNPCPWGGNHSFLLSLYRQAGGGECPVVFDLNTPSCGGGRFGCWTCTVVKEDKSLQGFIRSGEDHLQPLVDFRNWLVGLRDEPRYRSHVRRNGNAGPGPFLPAARQEILESVLALEERMGFPLITDEELAYIQTEWSAEFDYRNQMAVQIAAKYGRVITMSDAIRKDDLSAEYEMIEAAAVEAGVDPDLLRQALDIRRKKFPSLDKWDAKTGFERALGDLVEKAARQAEQTVET